MAVDIRAMACNYLRNGKVTVTGALSGLDGHPAHVEATIVGNSATYKAGLSAGFWFCSCGEPDYCAHVAAIQLVTGHDGLARKPGEASR